MNSHSFQFLTHKIILENKILTIGGWGGPNVRKPVLHFGGNWEETLEFFFLS